MRAHSRVADRQRRERLARQVRKDARLFSPQLGLFQGQGGLHHVLHLTGKGFSPVCPFKN